MEFNRLLSSAISAYGEPDLKKSKMKKDKNENQQSINNKNYHLIKNLNEIDEWIEEAEEIGEIAVDTETDFFRSTSSKFSRISFAQRLVKLVIYQLVINQKAVY